MAMTFREVKLRRDPACPACGDHPTIGDVVEYEQFCGLPPTEIQQEKETLAEYDITPIQMQKMRAENPALFVLDVREPHEISICAIDGTYKIPLGQLAERYAEVPADQPVVVHCKLGGRSAQAVEFLQSKGYSDIKNLAGGIIAWADTVDDRLQKY